MTMPIAKVGVVVVGAMLAGSVAAAGLPIDEPENHGMSSERLARLERVMIEYVDTGRLPGVLTAVARNGRVVHFSTSGMGDVRARKSLRPDSIFRFTTMTKPVTTVAALMLFEEGRFLLTDPVGLYVPAFGAMRVMTGGSADEPETRSASRPITIRDLMTHTSGLIYGDPDGDELARLYADAELFEAPDLASFADRLAGLPLRSDPGTRWHYGAGIDLLGYVVETISGQTFDAFLESRIFEPLAMSDTGFFVPDEKIDRFASAYVYEEERGLRRVESARRSRYRDTDAVPFGGRGLVSTAADYLRFAQMLANGGELDGVRLLSPMTVDLMMTDHLTGLMTDRAMGETWLAMTENRTGDTRLGFGAGLGGLVLVDPVVNGVPGASGHYGSSGDQNTYFWIDRTNRLVGLLLTQLSPSGTLPLHAQMRQLTYQALIEPEAR